MSYVQWQEPYHAHAYNSLLHMPHSAWNSVMPHSSWNRVVHYKKYHTPMHNPSMCTNYAILGTMLQAPQTNMFVSCHMYNFIQLHDLTMYLWHTILKFVKNVVQHLKCRSNNLAHLLKPFGNKYSIKSITHTSI